MASRSASVSLGACVLRNSPNALISSGLAGQPTFCSPGMIFESASFLPATSWAQAGAFMGVASCSGSTCHGRAEGNGAIVRQDEIAAWQEQSSPTGAHSRALAVLSGARGRAIAATLGLSNPTAAPACLGCHATTAGGGGQGTKFRTGDGVGCESCHGAAGGWLAVHYTRAANHASNVAAGMTALERPQVRANTCLDCHWGSAKGNQFVTHAMMAAGHPRLSFELDLFSALQQHHSEQQLRIHQDVTVHFSFSLLVIQSSLDF